MSLYTMLSPEEAV